MLKKIFFLFLILPSISFANINFSEIMFDPEGSDTDREWVEIINDGNITVNIEDFKFCDSGSCHGFFDGYGNDFKIPKNSFGIIAKNPDKFRIDYPDFDGFILRASFSLRNNPGELLELKDNNGSTISVVEYDPEVGGINGNSFSLFDDIWKNGKDTPGVVNILKEDNGGGENDEKEDGGNSEEDESQNIERTYVEISDMINGKKKLKAEIIDNIPSLIAGAENEFNGRAYGITGIEISGAEFFWTLGDGEKEYGKNIKHTFLYPGEYIVTLVVKSASFTGNTRRVIKVIEPNIQISEVNSEKNWIKLKNNYSEILKLDGWFLMVDGKKFQIPKESYILANGEIIFPNQITNLDVRSDSKIYLLFPNGEKVTKFIKESEAVISSPIVKNKYSSKIIKNNIENTYKKEKVIKKKNNSENNTENKSEYFLRNFTFTEKVEAKESAEENLKTKFNENSVAQELKLKDSRNFIMENIYFISFIFLMAVLVIISFVLNYFQKKEEIDSELRLEAKEFLIEEID